MKAIKKPHDPGETSNKVAEAIDRYFNEHNRLPQLVTVTDKVMADILVHLNGKNTYQSGNIKIAIFGQMIIAPAEGRFQVGMEMK